MDILSIAWLRSTKTETKEAWSAKGHSYIWIYQLNIIKYLQRCDNRHEYGFTVNAFWPCLPRCNGFGISLFCSNTHKINNVFIHIYLSLLLYPTSNIALLHTPFNYRKFTMHTHRERELHSHMHFFILFSIIHYFESSIKCQLWHNARNCINSHPFCLLLMSVLVVFSSKEKKGIALPNDESIWKPLDACNLHTAKKREKHLFGIYL